MSIRVCNISDVECSQGCGTGACKKEATEKAVAATLERAGESPVDAARMAHESVAQPDERADATFLRKSDERHVETFRHRDYACIIEQQEIAAVVRYLNALESRATQQANKGDERAVAERCAQFAELYRKEHATSRDAEEACTEIAEACRQYATPFPVAGSAGQAPEAWKLVPVEPNDAMIEAADKVWHAPHQCADPTMHVWDAMLAAAPTAPSLTTDAGAVSDGTQSIAQDKDAERWRKLKSFALPNYQIRGWNEKLMEDQLITVTCITWECFEATLDNLENKDGKS